MGCTQGLTRIFVFVTNLAFLLIGLALLVVGILYKVNFTKYTEAIPEEYSSLQNVPTLAIIVGSIIFFIAFLGCCGALRSNTCMLSWYGAILIVIFLLQVGLGIWALIEIKDKNHLESQITKQLNTLFNRYNSGNANKEEREVIDAIQQNFECCGTQGDTFWTNVPASCYPDKDTGKIRFVKGCDSAVAPFISSSIKNIALVALTVSVVEVVGAILALCLAGCIRDSRRQGSYY